MVDENELLEESCQGWSYRALGEKHGISHEQARQLVQDALDILVWSCVTTMYREHIADMDGAEPVTPWVVSAPFGPDYQAGMRLVARIEQQLRQRAVPYRVEVARVAVASRDADGNPLPGVTYRFKLNPETNPVDAAEEE